jgi:hypothetical protein
MSVSKAVQYLKGKSSNKLMSEYKLLKKRYWGQHLWVRGYWVATSGNVTDEVWMEYIKRINSHPNLRMNSVLSDQPTAFIGSMTGFQPSIEATGSQPVETFTIPLSVKKIH